MLLNKNNLYNLDCIEGMRYLNSEYIDFVFADPPYKLIGGGMNSKFANSSGMKRDKNPFSVFSTKGNIFKIPEIKDWIYELYRVLKLNTLTIIMTNERSIEDLLYHAQKAGFYFCEILIMKKQNKVVNPYFFKQSEIALLFRKGRYKKLNKQGTSNVFEVKLKRGKDKIHPTEKPLDFLKNLILNCSNPKDIILDPFAGSGNTLKAAKQLNRKYIGFEIDENFYKKAIINIFKEV